jgi:hypothetical protein
MENGIDRRGGITVVERFAQSISRRLRSTWLRPGMLESRTLAYQLAQSFRIAMFDVARQLTGNGISRSHSSPNAGGTFGEMSPSCFLMAFMT